MKSKIKIILIIFLIGSISNVSALEFGTEVCYNSAATDYNTICKLDATHCIVAYKDVGGSGYGCARVGLIDGNTVTWGAENIFNSGVTNYVKVSALNSTHFVVSYQDNSNSNYGTAIIGKVIGTTISSYGAANVFNSATTYPLAVSTLDSTHFVVSYRDGGNSEYGTAIVGLVSGTTISSYGVANVFNSASTYEMSVSTLDSTHFVVSYRNSGSSSYGTGRIGLVSGTTISSYGAANVFNSASTYEMSVSTLDSTHFVVSYRDGGNSNYGTSIIGLVSGTTISSYGAANVFNEASVYHTLVSTLNSTHFVIVYQDIGNSNYGTSIIGLVSGTTISSYGVENVFNSVYTNYVSVAPSSSTDYIVVYKDDGDLDYGCSKVWGATPPPPPSISIDLISFDPDPIKTDYVGKFNISYGITHNSTGLNNSSIAYLFAVNYTIDNCYNHSIRVPSNSIATTTPSITEYGNIFRGFRRNITPYLNQEFNTTITEGNIWKWGMYDHDVYPHVLVNPINATYTFVNMTSYRVMVLEQMHYLAAFDMFCIPKTDYEISVDQSLITKMWDVEQINDRDDNYLIYGHFPTGIKSITPTSDLDIYMCNDTFNPLTSDYTTCPCCTLIDSWDVARCTNYTLNPHANAVFVDPLVVNVSTLQIDITPTNYIIFTSNTPAHKPYIIKMTNADPGITNLTWADTKVSWKFDEIGKTASPYSYTPGIFYNFIRDYEQLEIQLYAADNTGNWGHSGINTYPIGIFAPQNPNSGAINYFNISGVKDYGMSGYYLNDIYVGVLCGNDPDGGSVTHTLNLYGNDVFESAINTSFSCWGYPLIEILFNSTPYTSTDVEYYLELVTTDSDDNSVSSYSPIFYISPVPTNTIFIYYPNLNSTTEINYADGSGYHEIIGDNLTMHGIKVISLKNKIIADDIITNPYHILKEKNVYLIFYLLIFLILIVGGISLIKRMW